MPLYLGNQKIDKVLTEHTSFILDAPNELSEQEAIIENLQDAVKTLGINIAENNDGILDSVELTAVERLQKNNDTLEEITDSINTLSISNIYTVSTDEEPDASLGNNGDLYLVVSVE